MQALPAFLREHVLRSGIVLLFVVVATSCGAALNACEKQLSVLYRLGDAGLRVYDSHINDMQ